MKQVYGMSKTGDLQEAIKGITNPAALLLMTSAEKLEEHARQLEEVFPGVPSIGAVGHSYGDENTNVEGVTVVALSDGIKAVANVVEELTTMPVKYIQRVENDLKAVDARADNTVCFDFCTGQDSKLVTTFASVLEKRDISLVGGTSDSKAVSMNGKLYEDSCVYLMLKNERGKVKVYKENIYKPMLEHRMSATKTKPEEYKILEIDDKPAEQVYRERLHISKEEVKTQTFKNPMGRCYGSEVYLISIKQVEGSALECYRQVNNMDVLTMLEIDDYRQVVKDTVAKIRQDLGRVSAVLSVNCLFRYLLFNEEKYWNDYLAEMCSSFTHAGLVGMGEHFKNQHVNQTMCCVAFE